MIQQTFNPPAGDHLSPPRPANWATQITFAEAMRQLVKASVSAMSAMSALGVTADMTFTPGGEIKVDYEPEFAHVTMLGENHRRHIRIH